MRSLGKTPSFYGPGGESVPGGIAEVTGHSARHTRIIVTRYGGPDVLQAVEEECPEPKEGEVRVRVLAAGVALPDLMMREGLHPETPRVPFTPGWDQHPDPETGQAGLV